MARRTPRSLLWRLGLALIAAQVVVGAVVGVSTYQRIREFHLGQSLHELQRITPLVIARLSGDLGRPGADALDADIKRYGAESDLRITIVLPDGRVIADSEADPATMDDHRFRPEIDAAITSGRGTSVRHSATVGASLMYYAQPVHDAEGRLAAVVRTALPLSRINADFARLARVIGAAALVTMALTLGLVLAVSRHYARQVRALADGAARFAAGEFEYRISPPATEELFELARGLNDMARQLGRQIAALRRQQNEQRAILQSMSNGVMALDLEQRILLLNEAAARMFALDGAAAKGRLLQELIREPALHRYVDEALRTGSVRAGDLSLEGRPGTVLHVVSDALSDAQERPSGLLLILDDVTQERRYDALRSDFAANVSHELRTPITNIKGYVETLLDVGVADETRTRRFLDIVSKNSSRLAAIVEDVMSLSKLEQPHAAQRLEKHPTRLATIIRDVVAQFESAARAKRIAILVEAPADLAPKVHAQLLDQAIGNLVSNAINYSPPDTTVRIRAGRQADGQIAISVIDEGPGIGAEHLPRLFERFYRVDKARSRDLGGTGLGLALVKHIALVHDGQVRVESRPGRGSTFTIELPAS